LLGIAIGAYPALYLTRGSIANALRGRFEHSRSGQRLRSGLVVAQFALSAVLVVGSVGVWQQVQHMKAVDPGVDEDRVVVADVTTEPFNSSETADARLRAMRDRLLQSPEVEAVSFSGVVPTNYKGNFNTYQVSGSSGSDIRFRQVAVDQHYFDTYGVELSAGRPFRPVTTGKTWLTDRGAIVNAAGAEAIRARTGDSTVVGTTLTPGGASFKLEVRAVTRSFRFGSAETNTTPVVHFYSGDHPSHYDYMSVRLAPGTTQAGMDRLRTEWDRVYPAVPLDYFFVDNAFDQLYRTQERIGALAGIAAALAVFLACLGLLGLAAFAIRQRLREISIRKVLGASAESIVLLLSKDFLKLVGLALAAGLPAAYVLLDWWLADFAVRIDLSLRLFVLSGAGMIALAFATVGLRAARAALLEPAPVLQSGE
jgi:putative ABC transport system permease protein